jgi:hypothetical protein
MRAASICWSCWTCAKNHHQQTEHGPLNNSTRMLPVSSAECLQVTPEDAFSNTRTYLDYRLSCVSLHFCRSHEETRSWRSAVPVHISSSAQVVQAGPDLITGNTDFPNIAKSADAAAKRPVGPVNEVHAANKTSVGGQCPGAAMCSSLRWLNTSQAQPMSILPSAGQMAWEATSPTRRCDAVADP